MHTFIIKYAIIYASVYELQRGSKCIVRCGEGEVSRSELRAQWNKALGEEARKVLIANIACEVQRQPQHEYNAI